MPIAKKPKLTSQTFSPAQISAAIAAAEEGSPAAKNIDWSIGVATSGGGVSETLSQLRRVRGRNKSPTKEQVALRLDPDVLAAFRASGRGWQTRMNTVLKEWLKTDALGGKSEASSKPGG